MHQTYSLDFHEFAKEVMDDLSVLNLPITLRSLDRYSWDGIDRDKDPSYTSAEYIDVNAGTLRYAPCVDLRYAYDVLRQGGSHDDALVHVINDIEREVNQYINEEKYLHNEKALLGNLLDTLWTIDCLCQKDPERLEGLENEIDEEAEEFESLDIEDIPCCG